MGRVVYPEGPEVAWPGATFRPRALGALESLALAPRPLVGAARSSLLGPAPLPVGRVRFPWGPPSNLWHSWHEAGGDPTKLDGVLDDEAFDLCGGGSHWTASGSARPTWRDGTSLGINGRPCWDLDGSAQYWARTGTAYAGDLTFVVALRPDAPSSTQGLLGHEYPRTYLRSISTGGVQVGGASGAYATGATLVAGTPVVLAMRFDGTNAKTWTNGVPTGTLVTAITAFDAGATCRVGMHDSLYFNGRIGCWGLAYAALSDSAVESGSLAIKARYGI